jgi:hypothetical protein
MKRAFDGPLERPKASRVLAEVRRKCHAATVITDPGRRMEAAFALSVDARMLLVAGLKAQGFSETEIRALNSEKP